MDPAPTMPVSSRTAAIRIDRNIAVIIVWVLWTVKRLLAHSLSRGSVLTDYGKRRKFKFNTHVVPQFDGRADHNGKGRSTFA
jgi:hypothetical protein